MQHHPSQFTRNSTIDVFDNGEICWKEDVEITLLNLSRGLISTSLQITANIKDLHMAY